MLSNQTVRSWLLGNVKMTKSQEREWGRALVEPYRPKNSKAKAWSGLLGEQLIREIYPDGWSPKKLGGFKPDWETKDVVIEVKTQSWFTPGTAGEKILGVPVKYRNLPALYNKPLVIVCFGRAESIWFDMPRDETLVRIIDFWASMNITYQRGSELIPPQSEPLGFSNESLDELQVPERLETHSSQVGLEHCS
jgi:hypothetical protein